MIESVWVDDNYFEPIASHRKLYQDNKFAKHSGGYLLRSERHIGFSKKRRNVYAALQAEMAKVSKTIISRIFRGGSVESNIRQRILEIAAESSKDQQSYFKLCGQNARVTHNEKNGLSVA